MMMLLNSIAGNIKAADDVAADFAGSGLFDIVAITVTVTIVSTGY